MKKHKSKSRMLSFVKNGFRDLGYAFGWVVKILQRLI